MNILAHCRVYPLSTFYKPTALHIEWLRKDRFGNIVEESKEGDDGAHVGPVGYLHLIEHGFQMTKIKSSVVHRLIDELPNQTFILMIDIASCWREFATEYSHEEKSVAYMNSASLLHFESLINFLAQLNDNPQEALSRCKQAAPLQFQLASIVIDNISYYTHDNASYELLFKILRMLRSRYGCSVMTVGFGLDFYNGVEQSFATNKSYDIPTRLPMSYVKNMDCVLQRDNASTARVVYTKNSMP